MKWKLSYLPYASAALSFFVGILADFNDNYEMATAKFVNAAVWLLVAFRMEKEE